MVRQTTGTAEPGDGGGGGERQGHRSAVRYLRNEIGPSAPRMLLGRTLRARRLEHGLKLEDVARHMGCSGSKLSRIERGHHLFKEKDLLRLLFVYGVEEARERDRLLRLAELANQPTWWDRWSTVAPPYLQAVVSFEDMATRVKANDCVLLYGLLQTPAYAEALIRRGPGGGGAQDALLRLGRARRERFAAAPGKNLICVVHESALLNPVGSPEIMAGQMEHLITLSRRRGHQVRVAEQGRHYDLPVELGSTLLFDFEGRVPKVAYAENLDGGLFIQEEEMVDHRERAFDRLRAHALEPEASRSLLHELAERYRADGRSTGRGGAAGTAGAEDAGGSADTAGTASVEGTASASDATGAGGAAGSEGTDCTAGAEGTGDWSGATRAAGTDGQASAAGSASADGSKGTDCATGLRSH
ncbi:helix-turn-helix transcriptional regulator [Streptomyces sp. NPDC052077]|uniref:helix-turn-helix domain-containing protein n=1 Tax=Streptomyces sp. NPDC052077 TaxID=3154757 RepID=UPI003426A812